MKGDVTMRKNLKKLVTFLLVFVLCFSFCPSALAANGSVGKKSDESKEYYLDVVDENGNIITLFVEESTHYPEQFSTRSIPSHQGGTGGHTVGETKTVKVKITNAQLGGGFQIGAVLKGKALTKLGTLAGQAAVKAVGGTIAGGAGTVAIVAGVVGTVNTLVGKNGFQVTMTFKWTHFEHKIQGIDLYDWGLTGVKVVPY